MPELPEVETIVRSITPYLKGRRILSAEFSSRLVVKQGFGWLERILAGQCVRGVHRHGKFILIALDRGLLTVHLGMTGRLLVGATPGPHARAVFSLDRGNLVYDDIRHFGRIEWSDTIPARVEALGPDPLCVPLKEFRLMLRRRQRQVKPLLLDQRFLRGLGNIYADEILFEARIHPLALASKLGGKRTYGLYCAMRDVLERAIAHGGSSISDYVDAEGRPGSYQLFHQVYGREGRSCARCGAAVRRIVVAQRGTHYCPRCQCR